MTVKELRKILQGMKPDVEVLVRTGSGMYESCRADALDAVLDPVWGWDVASHDPLKEDGRERHPAIVISSVD